MWYVSAPIDEPSNKIQFPGVTQSLTGGVLGSLWDSCKLVWIRQIPVNFMCYDGHNCDSAHTGFE